jgi:hypothetical protein
MTIWLVYSSTASVTKITQSVLLVAAVGNLGTLHRQFKQKFEICTHFQFSKSRQLRQHAVMRN